MLFRRMRLINLTVVAGGVIGGKHTGGVVQRWSSIRPVDLLCLGPNDVFGGPIVVRNNLHTHTHTQTKALQLLRNRSEGADAFPAGKNLYESRGSER